jgi:endonuclease/exonuclease/phosphatase family metal-dependent hydrolase
LSHARIVPQVKAVAVVTVIAALFATGATAKRTPLSITVMTRNLYLGANLDPIVKAKSAPEAFAAVAAGWGQVQANDFPVRARAIAREITRVRPDFVGFQELTLYRTQTPADFTVTPATKVVLDYARELRRALVARHLKYRFVAIAPWTDAELPSGNPPTMDIRLTVRDALLVRTDAKIRISRVRRVQYATTTPLFGGLVIAKRGYVVADGVKNGRHFRVATTHLESFSDASQIAQGEELGESLAASKLPTVLLGDLNSRADGTGTPTRANLLALGFVDAWTQAHPNDVGLSCCHGDDLRQLGGPFYSRIDYILLRNGFRALGAGIVGQNPSDRVGGLWPSDHAGVWARLRLP